MMRLLTPADTDAWFHLRLSALADSPHSFYVALEEERSRGIAEWRKRFDKPTTEGFVVGSFDGAQLVGNVGVFRDDGAQGQHKAMIWGVYVAPGHRRQGWGVAMLREAMAQARRVGIEKLLLGVDATNAPARAAYEAVGFREYGLERDCFRVSGVPVDEVLMDLRLVD